MVQETAEIIEQAFALVSRNGSLSAEEGVEFGRALADLATRIERAVDILRQLVELVNPQTQPADFHLTPRELEILSHLAEGHSNSEIAKLCWISENTVKFHLKNLFRKLGVRDRGQAIMIARAISRRLDDARVDQRFSPNRKDAERPSIRFAPILPPAEGWR